MVSTPESPESWPCSPPQAIITATDTVCSRSEPIPRIVAFFDHYAAKELPVLLEAKARRDAEIREKSPRIVSIVPPDGARDVDPALRAVVVTFDRPMEPGNLAVLRADGEYPGAPGGRVGFDESGRVLTIPAKLRPGTGYAFGLNGEGYMHMRGKDGNVLAPVVIRFRTRDDR